MLRIRISFNPDPDQGKFSNPDSIKPVFGIRICYLFMDSDPDPFVFSSVSDPDTFYPDPDPGFFSQSGSRIRIRFRIQVKSPKFFKDMTQF